jgi:hypothetical protein
MLFVPNLDLSRCNAKLELTVGIGVLVAPKMEEKKYFMPLFLL